MGLTLLLSVAQWLIGSKTGRLVLLCEAAAIAFFAYTMHIEHKTTVALLAKEQQTTAAESNRRLQIIDKVSQASTKDSAALAALQVQNEKLRREVARLSKSRPAKPCLDADIVRGLQALRPEAGGGAIQP
jgi:hypothetical protein